MKLRAEYIFGKFVVSRIKSDPSAAYSKRGHQSSVAVHLLGLYGTKCFDMNQTGPQVHHARQVTPRKAFDRRYQETARVWRAGPSCLTDGGRLKRST
jgi:hypothetical protein